MIIKSKEFILRPITIKDSEAYHEMMKDKATIKGFLSTPNTLDETKKEIKTRLTNIKKKTEELFVIDVNGEFAGYVTVNKLNQEHFSHKGNLAYCLHPKFRGKGLTVKAVKLLVKHIFKKYKLKRLEAWCRTFNVASQKVLERSGFKLEGILKKNKCKNGKYLDDMVWSIIK